MRQAPRQRAVGCVKLESSGQYRSEGKDDTVDLKVIGWKAFKVDVLDKVFPDWTIASSKVGTLEGETQNYPGKAFDFYLVQDGPRESLGRWAVAERVLIHERDTPALGRVVFYFYEPRRN